MSASNMNPSIEAHLQAAKLALAVLTEALRANDITEGELRFALSQVTDEYCALVDTFCSAPAIGAPHYSENWEAWNVLGGAGHYGYLRTARVKP